MVEGGTRAARKEHVAKTISHGASARTDESRFLANSVHPTGHDKFAADGWQEAPITFIVRGCGRITYIYV